MAVGDVEPKVRAEEDELGGDEPSDTSLVAALAQGRLEALGELFRRHAATVRRVLCRYSGSLGTADVDDLCQEVFMTALEAAPRFRGEGSVKSWLCGIAIHHGKNRRRRGRLRSLLLERFGGAATAVAGATEDPVQGRTQARLDAVKALSLVTEEQREVLLLHAVDNLSGEEIASILGIREKTVWTRLHRARQRMRELLIEEEK